MKFVSRCLTLSVLALSGCGEPPDAIVAEVGEDAVRTSSLLDLVSALPPGQRTEKTGDEARRHYLQILVDGRLLILEARNRGIDTTQAVEKAVREAVDEKVSAMYRSKMPTGAPVTEEEMRKFFEREGFDEERELSRIVARDRETTDRLVEKLDSGEPFEEVARLHSIDRMTAQHGGRFGFRHASRARHAPRPGQTEDSALPFPVAGRRRGVRSDSSCRGGLAGGPLHRQQARGVREVHRSDKKGQ